jgi:Translation initiation factor 4E (eIF-4E)
MYKIYQKYILLLKIKKLKAFKLKFKNKWSLWFHELFDNDWSIKSYKKLYTFDNIAEFWILYNNIISLHNGMYFLMKNDILPIYEDKNNINGGYWSIKISNENILKTWIDLSIELIRGNLDKKNIISGITLSYKKKFYIIKIWITNKKYNNLSYLNLNNINIKKEDILYNNFLN